MNLTYAREKFIEGPQSIFLAGPTPREKEVESWRPEAIRLLDSMSFQGSVFIPEPRSGNWEWSVYDQIDWEDDGLTLATHIVFWVPRNMLNLPGLTTNIEWGEWHRSGKVTLGFPPEAEHIRHMSYKAKKFGVPVFNNLRNTLQAAVNRLGKNPPGRNL